MIVKFDNVSKCAIYFRLPGAYFRLIEIDMMAGCMYRFFVLHTLLSGIYASLVVHSDSETWVGAGESCVSDNQTLVNNIDEHLKQHLASCVNKEEHTFWTGGYTRTGIDYRITIAFHGCFKDSYHRLSVWRVTDAQTVSSCSGSCGRSLYGLTTNSCVCFGTATFNSEDFQRSNDCILGIEEYMGMNGSIALYIVKGDAGPRCSQHACRTLGPPLCSFYYCNGSIGDHDRLCNETSHYLCENGFTSREKVTWVEAVRACANKGSFLQGTIPNNWCKSSSVEYWSNVRQFDKQYVTKDTEFDSSINECDIAHLTHGGSLSLERTTDCKSKLLPYVCQSDDETNYIYIDSLLNRCNEQNNASTMNLETGTTTSMGIGSKLANRNLYASGTMTKTESNVIIIAGSISGIVAVAIVTVFVIIAARRYTKKRGSKKVENVYTLPNVTSTQKSEYDTLRHNDNSDATATREIVDAREILDLTMSSEAYEYMD